MFYDEQPETFKQSWNQRMRWSKGFYQVMFKYGRDLIMMAFKKRQMFISCYDMFMTIAPATLLSFWIIGIKFYLFDISCNKPNFI